MPIRDEDLLQILREAIEPLFPSEITAVLNQDFAAACTVDQVATRLARLQDQVAQLADGRWMLKRRLT